MSDIKPEKEFFFCRKGNEHIGPLDRRSLRRYLAAGLIDAETLVALNDSGEMLPLGTSAAAGEITRVIKSWQKKFSLPIYLIWLIFMPLLSAAFAAYGVFSTWHSGLMLLVALLFAQLGMSYWLWRTWSLLLADKPPVTALFYALPMALPAVNFFWIWIGYMQLPKYWERYKHKLGINDHIPYWIYNLATIFFYLMIIGVVLLFFNVSNGRILLILLVGLISWIWFGLTMLSLFVADHIGSRVIQTKLSNLAFGSLKFCADIDYDVLHRTVIIVARSNRRHSRILALTVLFISWFAGGWFWLHALEKSMTDHHGSYWHMARDCIICNPQKHLEYILKNDQSTLVNTNAERQGR